MPLLVEAFTVRVRVELIVAGFGFHDSVVPAGRPLTESVTGELNPFSRLIVTV